MGSLEEYNEFRDWELENLGPDPDLFPEESNAFWANKRAKNSVTGKSRFIRIRHHTTPEPSACRWCGYPERGHGLRFHRGSKYMEYEPPTPAQRKARIIALIKARKAAKKEH